MFMVNVRDIFVADAQTLECVKTLIMLHTFFKNTCAYTNSSKYYDFKHPHSYLIHKSVHRIQILCRFRHFVTCESNEQNDKRTDTPHIFNI